MNHQKKNEIEKYCLLFCSFVVNRLLPKPEKITMTCLQYLTAIMIIITLPKKELLAF